MSTGGSSQFENTAKENSVCSRTSSTSKRSNRKKITKLNFKSFFKKQQTRETRADGGRDKSANSNTNLKPSQQLSPEG